MKEENNKEPCYYLIKRDDSDFQFLIIIKGISIYEGIDGKVIKIFKNCLNSPYILNKRENVNSNMVIDKDKNINKLIERNLLEIL